MIGLQTLLEMKTKKKKHGEDNLWGRLRIITWMSTLQFILCWDSSLEILSILKEINIFLNYWRWVFGWYRHQSSSRDQLHSLWSSVSPLYFLWTTGVSWQFARLHRMNLKILNICLFSLFCLNTSLLIRW